MARTCWWYYISKFSEFFDTLFFILRKKNSHVSTLHVIHHGCMPFSVWMGMKFAPGGHSTFFALLNTFVHIVMYFYYMVSAMGPEFQRFLWWKRYLTSFQMLQFVAIFAHQFQLLFTECDYPKSFMIWIAVHGLMFLFLFSDFYKVNYRGAKPANQGACMVSDRLRVGNRFCCVGLHYPCQRAEHLTTQNVKNLQVFSWLCARIFVTLSKWLSVNLTLYTSR